MRISNEWQDYEIIMAGDERKIERFGSIYLDRPDPQAMWKLNNNEPFNVDGIFHRNKDGSGYWEYKTKLKEFWTISYKHLTFKVGPTNFKHMGIFPEQAVNWDLMMDKIKNSKRDNIKVLNLFAYTGCATMALASVNAKVTQVDASKKMTDWAKDNMRLSKLEDKEIHFIVDDCLKFVNREIRRGNKYDAIVMDPPSFGRGPKKEVWKFEKSIYELIELCLQILSDKPLFFLINSYTTGISSIVLENILKTTIQKKYPNGKISCGEIGLPITKDNLTLPCGIYGYFEE